MELANIQNQELQANEINAQLDKQMMKMDIQNRQANAAAGSLARQMTDKEANREDNKNRASSVSHNVFANKKRGGDGNVTSAAR